MPPAKGASYCLLCSLTLSAIRCHPDLAFASQTAFGRCFNAYTGFALTPCVLSQLATLFPM